MKSGLSKSSQKRSSQKFKTSLKISSGTSTNRSRPSTIKTNNPIPSAAKGRKSAIMITSKRLNNKKSLTTKDNTTVKKAKKSTTSLVKENNTANKNKIKTIKGKKSMRKSVKIDENINELNDENKKIENDKEINIANSDVFNSENNMNEINSEDNKSKSNQDNEKLNSITSKKDSKEMGSKSQSKKNSLKENELQANNNLKIDKNKRTLVDYNQHININLIKETNEKPNYRYEIKYENNIEQPETRLRNYKIESSDYISEKNKFLIRNLLYLLDKKPDDKKGIKNIFRSSLNASNNSEQNKILEMLDKTKNDIFRIKKDEKLNYINSSYADKKLSDIYQALFERNYPKKRFTSLEKYPPGQYYREKYFFNYVDGVHPNMYMILKNSMPNSNVRQDYWKSEKKYNLMGKNDLSVEKRDNRYLKYNYDFMINTIDDKLKKNYRQIYRKRRMQQMFNNIYLDIYELNNPEHENVFRKTFSEMKRNSIYL